MDTTHLDLLIRDGKETVTFYPALDQIHYEGLLELSLASSSAEELRTGIEIAAASWFREVEFEE
jgi:hypothetical protein